MKNRQNNQMNERPDIEEIQEQINNLCITADILEEQLARLTKQGERGDLQDKETQGPNQEFLIKTIGSST